MKLNKKGGVNVIYVIIIAFLCIVIGAAGSMLLLKQNPEVINVPTEHKEVTVTDDGIADAVNKIYDAVVVVSTYKNEKLYGTGTGFVYKVDGNKAYILTNNHVIENGTKVTVKFTNGNIIETDIVGSNALADIAVLSLDKKDIISVAEIGKSEESRVGDTAFAVGAPLDSIYSWTVTRGIISGKDRMVEVSLSGSNGDYVMKVLQTDAAINNGNSGGPLCNSNGEVIGVTSLKLSTTNVNTTTATIEGMGFAIPIEIALSYAEKIISKETFTQPFLGVQMYNVSDGYYLSSYYDLLSKNKVTDGVIVVSVDKNTPAGKAGIEQNDIIIKINDEDTPTIAFLRYYLYNYEVGDEVTLTVLRNGKEKKLQVVLGENKAL